MNKILNYVAYAAGTGQIIFVITQLPKTYGTTDMLVLLMFAVLPVVSAIMLYSGPTLEERRMMRQINKLKLRKELMELVNSNKSQKTKS